VETVFGGLNAAMVGIIAAFTIKLLNASVCHLWQMMVAAGALLMTTVGSALPREVALLGIVTGIAIDLGSNRARLVRPAILGLMAAAAVTLGGTLEGKAEISIAVAAGLTLARFELNPAAVLLLGGLTRLALHAAGL
jgi:chromate transport protein ChrA